MSPWEPLPGRAGRPDPGPRPVRDSLDRVAGGLGVGGADALATVFTRWADVVGADLAAHATPLSLARGRLVVAADDPAWAAQLRWLEADLLARLDAALGAGVVASVDVRVRPPKGPRTGPG